MKDIQTASDKKFLAAETKRREESRARQEANTTLVQGMLQAMERGFEERRRVEESIATVTRSLFLKYIS